MASIAIARGEDVGDRVTRLRRYWRKEGLVAISDLPANQVGVYIQRARKEALEIARAEGLL